MTPSPERSFPDETEVARIASLTDAAARKS